MFNLMKILKPSRFTILQLCCLSRSSRALRSVHPDEPIDILNPFEKEQKKCVLCKLKIVPDYKNVRLLSQFQSPYTGRIYGRHLTGLCKYQQLQVERAIIRAQNCALMPYYFKDSDFLADPMLFNPEKPVRPHKY